MTGHSASKVARWTGPVVVAASVVLGPLAPVASGHEPAFSFGPEVIWEGGTGVETEFEFEDGENEQVTALGYEVRHGFTPKLMAELEVPHVLEAEEGGETSHGLGDIELASTDLFVGGSYGYESRDWYYFITGLYRWQTESGGDDPGDILTIAPTIGYRPFQTGYQQWDVVFLGELNYEHVFEGQVGGEEDPDSGGNTVWLGPSALISPNPQWMFKIGAQWPVVQDLAGAQGEDNMRLKFAIEYHF